MRKYIVDRHTAGVPYLQLAMMARDNSSQKFTDPQDTEPQADVKELLCQVTRLVPRVLQGHRGDDLECHLAASTIAQHIVCITGQITVPKVLQNDIAQGPVTSRELLWNSQGISF